MEIQQKEQIYSQVQMMAKFTGETVNKDSLFSFLDEPQMDYKPKQAMGKLNNEISSRISGMIDSGLENLQPDKLQANVQSFSSASLMQTAGLKNAMDNHRISDALSKRQELMASKAANEKQMAPEKIQAAVKAPAGGPSL